MFSIAEELNAMARGEGDMCEAKPGKAFRF